MTEKKKKKSPPKRVVQAPTGDVTRKKKFKALKKVRKEKLEKELKEGKPKIPMRELLELSKDRTIDIDSLSASSVRELARLVYVTSPGMTLTDMAERHPVLKGVSRPALLRWSSTDNWTAGRKAFMRATQSHLEKESMSVIVEAFQEVMGTVTTLRKRLYKMLSVPGELEKLSTEGKARFLLKTMELEVKLLDSAVQQMAPVHNEPANLDEAMIGQQTVTIQLTPEEQQLTTQALLRAKMESIQRALGNTQTDEHDETQGRD